MEEMPNEIKMGSRIRLGKLDEEENYASQIIDMVDDIEMKVSGPMRQNNLIFLHNGELIRVYFTVKNKGRYSFTAKVISRSLDQLYALDIERISEIDKVQERSYFRLITGLEVFKTLETVIDGENKILEEVCEAKDISGGGLKIHCNEEHEINDVIECTLTIEDEDMTVEGVVKRIDVIDALNYKYSIGVAFSKVNERNRETIIKYIFEQQRILRNKGLI